MRSALPSSRPMSARLRLIPLATLGAALSAILLSGCGVNLTAVATGPTASVQSVPALHGTLMGGQTPIVNSTVAIYATGTDSNCKVGSSSVCTASDTGYGAGTFLQEASQVGTGSHQDTDASGNFSFAGGYYCPANEYAYLVATGGQPGGSGSAANSKILLVAALGRCEDLYSQATGQSYTTAPTVAITAATGDTTGSGATATATVSGGEITAVTVGSGGSAYTAVPTVSFSGGGGSGAAATAVLGVSSLSLTSGGVNYSSTPTVTVSGGGATTQATVSATVVSGVITGLTLNTAGSGYTSVPTISITDSAGSGATATASLSVISIAPNGRSGYAGNNIYINELTTVAAGYALGNFASVVSDANLGGAQSVFIGAPSTNNAPQVGGISTGTTTKAAGLYHAFLNAANLVSPFSATTLSTAPATATNNALVVAPQAMVNTIGNILANCVDSGGTGGQCTGLPGAADTFTAVKTLATNPTLSGSSVAVTALQNLPTGVAQFSPIITSSITDYSLAFNYTSASFANLKYPDTGAVDLNDNYYVAASAGSNTAPVYVYGFSSNSTLNGTGSNSSLKIPLGMSIDANGNGYFGDGSQSGNTALGYFTTSGGAPSTSVQGLAIVTPTLGSSTTGLFKIYGTAVDANNNLWMTGVTNSGSFVYSIVECASGATISAGTINCAGVANPTFTNNSAGALINVDPYQNIWVGQTATLVVLENTGSLLIPAYGTAPVTIPAANNITTAPNFLMGAAFTSGSPFNAYVSGYKTGTAGVQPITMTFDSNTYGVKSITAGTEITSSTALSGPYSDAADGNGTIWVADYNDHGISQVNPGASTAYILKPCMGSAATCTGAFSGKPTSVSLDSTGSIWTTLQTGANVVQFIGSAAPTWPLLSLGKLGKP